MSYKIDEEKLPYRKTICDFCSHFKETASWSFDYQCTLHDVSRISETECAGFEPNAYADTVGITAKPSV